MSSSIDGRDIVYKRQDVIIRGVYEFERDLCKTILAFCLEVMSRREGLLCADKILEPGLDASLEIEPLLISVLLIDEIEGDSWRKISGLLHSGDLDGLIEFDGLEHFRIRHEFYGSSHLIAFSEFLDVTIRYASLISLEIFFAVFVDGHFKPFAQSVYDRGSDAMKTS